MRKQSYEEEQLELKIVAPFPQLMTINRRGILNFDRSRNNMCVNQGERDFRYLVRVTCKPKLDRSGYLIEHSFIDQAVRSSTAPGSCEQLALQIARIVKDLFEAHNQPEIIGIYVRVRPYLPGKAFIEYQEGKVL